MKLEVRKQDGTLIATYKDDWAVGNFDKLIKEPSLFQFTTKKFTDYPEIEVPVFVVLANAEMAIAYDFRLHLFQGDYIKVIR